MHIMQSRRDFLASMSVAGTAGVLGTRASLADEAPPETTTLRLPFYPNICLAPGDIAEDLLRAEGFTDIRYIPDTAADALARGDIDFDFETAAWVVSHLDSGEPITALAGVHSGCYELFAHEPIRAISDLKGKKLGIYKIGSSGHLLLSVIAAQVGLDPNKDIEWVVPPSGNAMELFAAGEVDAFIALSARAAGIARPQDRSRDPQHGHGPAMVAVSLLHSGRQQGLRPRPSGRHQALPAGPPQGCRHLRDRAGGGRATAGRSGVHPAIRLRAPDADRTSLRPLARVRRCGLDALLRASPARGRHDQVQPERDHSPRAPTGAS